MIAALLLAVSLTSPAALPDASRAPASAHQTDKVQKVQKQKKAAQPVLAQAALADDPNSPDREPGFVDHYMPFQLASTALPEVKDGMIVSHVLGYLLPCGGLWGPVVMIDGAEFTGDVIISWLVSGLIWAVAMTVVGTLTVGVGYLAFLALPYLSTTATLNAIDRDLKKKGRKLPDAKKPSGGGNATPPPTGGTSETPPPSYAY